MSVKSSAEKPRPPAVKDGADETLEVGGRVLGPDGKPFAGARVCLLPLVLNPGEPLPPASAACRCGRVTMTPTPSSGPDATRGASSG